MRNLRPSLLLLFVHAALFAIDVRGAVLDEIFKQTLDAMQPAFDTALKEGEMSLPHIESFLELRGTLPEDQMQLSQGFWRQVQEFGDRERFFWATNKDLIDRDFERLQKSLHVVEAQVGVIPEAISVKVQALYAVELSRTLEFFAVNIHDDDQILERSYFKADGLINNLAWRSQDMQPIAYLMAHKAIAHDHIFARLLRKGQLSTKTILKAARAATMLDESTFPMFWSLRSSNLFYTLHGIGDPPEAAKKLQSLLLDRFVQKSLQEVRDRSILALLPEENLRGPWLSPKDLEKVLAVAGSMREPLNHKRFRDVTVEVIGSNRPIAELNWPTKEEAASLSRLSVVFVNKDHWSEPKLSLAVGDSRHRTHSQRRRSFGHP